MPNRWVEHVRAFAAKNKMSYMCAMSDPDIKKGYIPTEKKKQKTEKLEQAMPSTEPTPKNVVIKPRPEPEPVKAKKAPVKAKKAPAVKDWVFKATKDNYGSTEVERRYMLNVLPDDRKIAREGLYKNDQAEDFTVKDFKDAIDKSKKSQTSMLLRIAKMLQRSEMGKIIYYKREA